MTDSVLATRGFWADLGERLGRQAVQVAVPILFAANYAGDVDLKATGTIVGVALLVSLLKAFSGITPDPKEALAWQVVDRATPAVAGTLLGYVPVAALDITSVDWPHAAWASLGAGVLSVVAYYLTPPTTAIVVDLPQRDEPTTGDEPAHRADGPAV